VTAAVVVGVRLLDVSSTRLDCRVEDAVVADAYSADDRVAVVPRVS
jgi:hypothetical protein